MTSLRLFPVLALLLTLGMAAQQQPRNIIFMIGDGMGVAQLSAQILANPASHLRRFPVGGFSITRSATHLVTESAAGGTALSTGRRTRNGAVAQDTSGVPLETLLERARKHGRATGVVSTSSITHATPASFLAHVDSRKKEAEIAAQIARSGVDVVIGGGASFFLPKPHGLRDDGADWLDTLQNIGYATPVSIDAVSAGDAGRLCMLLAPEGLPPAGARSYGLADLTRLALSRLAADPDGFVLMVEGSQIDWAAHDNNFAQLLAEMRDFDEAVGAALDFADSAGSTLVVVAADHETGGLSLVGKAIDGSDMEGKWQNDDHTAVMVPVLARGPAASMFGGIHDNAEIGRMLIDLIVP